MARRRALLLKPHEDGTQRLALRRSLDRQRVSRLLKERLDSKIRNYEREATKLEVRGQSDAADVLRKAADKLRVITRKTHAKEADG